MAGQQPQAVEFQPPAQIQMQPTCQPEPAVESQLSAAESALLRIFMGPGDMQAKLHTAVDDAYAVITFPNIAKVGFFVTAAQGKGLLSYRQADGQWSYPIVVSARVTSVGPHFSMQTIDMMIVAKTHEALMRLLAGGSPAQAAQKQNVAAQIVTYSSSLGLTAGLSLDDYKITIDQEANQGLYCQPILAEDLTREGHKMTFKPPPCAQKFAQTMNRVSGRAPIIRSY
jgi:lipid-binding SYLF domain-containing protein